MIVSDFNKLIAFKLGSIPEQLHINTMEKTPEVDRWIPLPEALNSTREMLVFHPLLRKD